MWHPGPQHQGYRHSFCGDVRVVRLDAKRPHVPEGQTRLRGFRKPLAHVRCAADICRRQRKGSFAMATAAPSQGPGAIEQLATWVLAQRTQALTDTAIHQAK